MMYKMMSSSIMPESSKRVEFMMFMKKKKFK